MSLPNSVNQQLPLPSPSNTDGTSIVRTLTGWANGLVQSLLGYGDAINQLLAQVTTNTSDIATIKGELITPTITKLTSGSGTYTPPANAKWLRVRMVGGGGGGGGTNGAVGTLGGTGGTTTFGSSLLTCTGGAGGQGISAPSVGGTATINSPAYGFALNGAYGNGYPRVDVAGAYVNGLSGAPTPFGGGGAGADPNDVGRAPSANTGAGGGSAGTNSYSYGSSPGAAGAYIDAIIPAPLAASYPYAIGAGGTAGPANAGNAGGPGASGYIEIEENYG